MSAATNPVRPPGSLPEDAFLQACIHCGECFQACPNDVLQPMGFEQGFEGLWSPRVDANWAGCESTCNNCGQVCPTGAIRALPIEEKRVARMGLAKVPGKEDRIASGSYLALRERERQQKPSASPPERFLPARLSPGPVAAA